MAGTKTGGQKLKATLLAKYGEDYWAKMGSLGGSVKNPRKGFGTDHRSLKDKLLGHEKLAIRAGRIGGRKSKRTKKIYA